jgi:hypothetical protein
MILGSQKLLKRSGLFEADMKGTLFVRAAFASGVKLHKYLKSLFLDSLAVDAVKQA